MDSYKPLRLVKDLIDFRITFYWIDTQNQTVSPLLETLDSAREWFICYQFAAYPGQERRRSHLDRRHSKSAYSLRNSDRFSKRNANSHGRRLTDQPVHIAIDQAAEKIDGLKSQWRSAGADASAGAESQ